jgi:hypothetical protein
MILQIIIFVNNYFRLTHKIIKNNAKIFKKEKIYLSLRKFSCNFCDFLENIRDFFK